jgi:hypothetical protein
MSHFQGRLQASGQISDSADATETYFQLCEFRDLVRDGWLIDTSALYATMAFCSGDVVVDARLYAQGVVSDLPSEALKAAANQVIEQPTPVNVRSFANQCRAWLFTAAETADRNDIAVVRDAMQRADLYSAAFEHVGACESAAGHAYDYAFRQRNPVVITRCVAVALGLLDQAQTLSAGNRPILSITHGEWLRRAITRLQYASNALDEHVEAAKAFSSKQDETDPVSDLLSDIPDVAANADNSELQVDLDALLDAATASRPIIEQQSLPTIMVLQSLSHLPEQKSTSSPNPRLEFAPIAGVYMTLAETPDLQAASRELVAEMPWAEDVITSVLMDSVGPAVSRVRTTLLVGEPGSGKTRLARRIGEVLGMQPTIVPAAGAADASFGGTNRQWSTSRASIPLQTIRRTGIANPLVIIDEIEKAGDGKHNGNMLDVLLPFFEIESAKRYHDPYLECAVDLSMIGYIATSNSRSTIPGPLLDRLRVLEVPQPRKQDLKIVARTILSEIRQERREDEIWTPDLDGDELEILAKQWHGGSLRPLKRMVEVLLAGRMSLAPRH